MNCAEGKYHHVIVVGIDGAGAFIRDADTPCFDRIFEKGAVTYDALASNPSISAECWGAMLLGVGPEVHKLTNQIVNEREYPTDAPFPSLFRRIRQHFPDAELGSFCDWNPITKGMIEPNVVVSSATARDRFLAPMICEYIKEKKPNFLFIQFDSVDSAGHHFGYGKEEHMKRIGEVDLLVNDVYEAAKEAGILEDTLFIVISDHGGINYEDRPGGRHGGWSDTEKYVTLALAGKTVLNRPIGEANVRDLAAIVLYAFGIEAPAFDEEGWTSQIPDNIFDDPGIPPYRDISHLTGAAPRVSKVPHTSELI